MKALVRRLSKLEALRKPGGPPRVIVRFVDGSGQDRDAEPKEDIDENDPDTTLVIVQYVDRPAKAPLRSTE